MSGRRALCEEAGLLAVHWRRIQAERLCAWHLPLFIRVLSPHPQPSVRVHPSQCPPRRTRRSYVDVRPSLATPPRVAIAPAHRACRPASLRLQAHLLARCPFTTLPAVRLTGTVWKSGMLHGRDDDCALERQDRERYSTETKAATSGVVRVVRRFSSLSTPDAQIPAVSPTISTGSRFQITARLTLSAPIQRDGPSNTASSDDVFRARSKTIGACGYKFEMELGFESGAEWCMILDVGGSRSQVRLVYPCASRLVLTATAAT